jgi:hypothetical protein
MLEVKKGLATYFLARWIVDSQLLNHPVSVADPDMTIGVTLLLMLQRQRVKKTMIEEIINKIIIDMQRFPLS